MIEITCAHCGYVLLKTGNIERITNIHRYIGSIRCPQCYAQFNVSKNPRFQHILYNTSEKPPTSFTPSFRPLTIDDAHNLIYVIRNYLSGGVLEDSYVLSKINDLGMWIHVYHIYNNSVSRVQHLVTSLGFLKSPNVYDSLKQALDIIKDSIKSHARSLKKIHIELTITGNETNEEFVLGYHALLIRGYKFIRVLLPHAIIERVEATRMPALNIVSDLCRDASCFNLPTQSFFEWKRDEIIERKMWLYNPLKCTVGRRA